ncbi:unnamed protein product, partial [marine sediment metagenome]
YTFSDIDKIIEFKSWSVRKITDELLRIDCSQYTNLGSDSLKSERLEVKKNSRKIYKAIKTVDSELGSRLLDAMDK